MVRQSRSLFLTHGHWRPIRGEDIQLDRNSMGRLAAPHYRDALRARLCIHFRYGRAVRAVSGQPEIDAYFHDTYFVVAHFHLIMGIAALFGIFAATFYWFPLLFGRLMDERLGKLHFYLTFIGAYADLSADAFRRFRWQSAPLSGLHHVRFPRSALMPLQRWITYPHSVLASVQIVFLWNLFRSIGVAPLAPTNPWRATGLEWSEHEGPVVRGPYEYHEDCILQNQQNPVKG